MKYLYEYCDMKSIRTQIYLNNVTNGYLKKYKESISVQAEKLALKTHSNGVYPDIFPWEINCVLTQIINLPLELILLIGYLIGYLIVIMYLIIN